MNFAPEYFPSFPVPAKNETVFSLFTRCKARSGFSDAVMLQELTGQRLKRALLASLPGYLPSISMNVPDSHPCKDPLFMIRNHTMFPYFSYFMASSTRLGLEAKLALSDRTQPIGLSLGLTQYPMKDVSSLRFCMSCVKEAWEQIGFPYFRVEHQLPGVLLCSKHMEVLNRGCERCGSYPIPTASLSMAGQCKCSTGIEPLPVVKIDTSELQPLIWLAEQSAYLLGRPGTNSINPSMSIRQRAILSQGGRQNNISYSCIASKITDIFGSNVLRLLNVETFTESGAATWIRRFFDNNKGNSPVILYLLMIGAYFQSVEEYERIAETESDDIVSYSSERKYNQTTLQKHRKILDNLVDAEQGINRGDVQKKVPGTYDFLLRHDKQYFQTRVQRAKPTCLKPKKTKDWPILDKIKAVEIMRIFNLEYTKDLKPVFITSSSALKACNILQKYRTNPDRFPEVSCLLANNLESRDSFHKRRLRWAIIQMTSKNTPISLRKLRQTADLLNDVVRLQRDFILSTVNEVKGVVNDGSFLV